MMIALILTTIALSVPGTTAGLSTNLGNFVTVLNGYYDNRAQYERNKKAHDFVQFKILSVTTPAFPDQLVLFEEWSYNGVVLELLLMTPYEDTDGVIHLPLYNFTDPSLYKPGEYNVEDLSKLTPQDLQPSPCEAEYEPNGPGEYFGTWPDHYIDGTPDLFTCSFSCDIFDIVIPRSGKETFSALPYNLIRYEDKFPVPDLPDGFVSPCQ